MITNRKRSVWSLFEARRERHHQRQACRLPGLMILTPRDVEIQGLILDISPAGCRFRPELAFLVQRGGETVAIEIGARRFSGQIVATTPFGYGVRFDEEHDVSDLV
ncbi:MAG: hypothetical protein EBZ50_01680 [Alphaproteobacteria bacterium]|nr:hypothetical protein [Alphaproteobacteria bacterium]